MSHRETTLRHFFLAGLGLAFLLQAIDTKVRTGDEIGEALGLPLLGRLPTPDRDAASSGPLSMNEAPNSADAEAFRTLATNVLLANLGVRAQVIMVTSAIAEEGKSTAAAKLAVALARSGHSTTLIDLDLRRPSLSRLFHWDPEARGIADVTVGGASLEQVSVMVDCATGINSIGTFSLSNSNGHQPVQGALRLVPAGRPVPEPAGVIGSAELAGILDRLRGTGDLILIDTPPLLQVGDALALMTRVDAVLVVAHLGLLNRSTVRELARVLSLCPAKLLGFALTGADQGDDSAYDDYVRYARPRQREEVEV